MEEILPSLKGMLKDATVIKTDAANLEITITLVHKINENVAEPDEILIMLKMFGGLKEDVPMEIDINNETQTISMQFLNEEDFKKVDKIMDTIWDDAVDLFVQTLEGDLSGIKDIPNIDD
ncbi:MAG: hypothetical protein KGD67_12300 [Candidatus Lokiarchaeota archaeon]|nr:hypothetical protein [Candidatus Lokiarchaeota archaeon]